MIFVVVFFRGDLRGDLKTRVDFYRSFLQETIWNQLKAIFACFCSRFYM
jgi:hypothetical protein